MSQSQPDDSLEPPSSQQTVVSTSPSDCTAPFRYSSATTSLERVGPTLQRYWILYNTDPVMEEFRKQFVDWWLTTEFGARKELQTTIRWDGKKKSDVWERFDQVAHEKTGEPKVKCKQCHAIIVHPNHHRAGSSPMKGHLTTSTCLCRPKATKRRIDQLLRHSPRVPPSTMFHQDTFEARLLEFITSVRLPFRIVEHPAFKDLLDVAQLADSKINIPSARSIRRRLDQSAEEQRQTVLGKLPEGSKLSIALDCWTSPFSQAFMAITGYFLDQEWNYREVLLGFEHLYGSHTGDNLSKTVIEILQQYGVADRVLSITTDNASNNNTMITSVQETVQSFGLGNASIFRVPCIPHVIQLSLNQLLGKIKAKPLNQEAETEWSDKRTRSLQSRQPTQEIMDTLKKVRELAVFVNASPQRREAFLALQTKEPRLIPIQDVRTRWNSTFLMLSRAKKLQSIINQYCTTHQYVQFKLDQDEWRQIEYLLLITKPFFDYTTILSKTKDVTIHSVFSIYNGLFSHLDASEKQLKRKGVPWKKQMLKALRAARKKLSAYYTAIETEAYGNIYAIATILSPSKKLQHFGSKDWKGEVDFQAQYRKVLEKEFERYQQQLSDPTETPEVDIVLAPTCDFNDLDMIGECQATVQIAVDPEDDEITRYLAKGLVKSNPRVYWKEHEQEFPILAKMARDILSIPASGAGVERLFNCARDICHYRRGQLRAETVRDLMLCLCSTRFDLEQSQIDIWKEYLSAGEAAMMDQVRKPDPLGNDVEPISDDEEEGRQDNDLEDSEDDEEEDDRDDELSPVQVTTKSRRAQQKRPRKRSSDAPPDDADHGLPLPEMLHEESTQARSGRIRKRPKMPEGFEIDKL